jgi:CYTH domain-containing protein
VGVEIEHKFIVRGDDWKHAVTEIFDITQGYLEQKAVKVI